MISWIHQIDGNCKFNYRIHETHNVLSSNTHCIANWLNLNFILLTLLFTSVGIVYATQICYFLVHDAFKPLIQTNCVLCTSSLSICFQIKLIWKNINHMACRCSWLTLDSIQKCSISLTILSPWPTTYAYHVLWQSEPLRRERKLVRIKHVLIMKNLTYAWNQIKSENLPHVSL